MLILAESSEFTVSLITLTGTIVVSTVSLLAVLLKLLTQTRQVNDAVNHQHLKDKDEDGNHPLKLYDLTIANSADLREVLEWKRKCMKAGNPSEVAARLKRDSDRLGTLEEIINEAYPEHARRIQKRKTKRDTDHGN